MCLQMTLDFLTHRGSQVKNDIGTMYLWGHLGTLEIAN
jgi:hypothetical protein